MQNIRCNRWMVLAVLLLAVSGSAMAQFSITVSFGPPAIPVYEQPMCPGDGYIWTPGYWAWDPDFGDYYWVPGTWVMAPEVGYLWTPPWWGWDGGVYVFHAGYWGPHVGFYGGINYGFGYTGDGYWGGRWDRGRFFYNREVTRVNVTNITNVYNEHVTIVNNSRVSYNGGRDGVMARPNRQQEEWGRERHVTAVEPQIEHARMARDQVDLRAKVNHGAPSIAATERPGALHEHFTPAREPGMPFSRYGGATQGNYVHPKEMPAMDRMPAPNTGNPKMDRKYQQQQDKLYNRQQQDLQKLQQRQDNEHAKMQRQNAAPQYQQRVEQKHQQQTQAMSQKHTQQREQMQAKETPPNRKH